MYREILDSKSFKDLKLHVSLQGFASKSLNFPLEKYKGRLDKVKNTDWAPLVKS